MATRLGKSITCRHRGWDSLLHLQRCHQEEGSSVATALAVGLIATMLATTAIYFAQSDLAQGTYNRDWTGAIAAAEAGMNRYLSKLEDDPQYWALAPSMRDPAYFPGEQGWVDVPEGQGQYRLEITPLPRTVGRPVHVLVRSSGRVRVGGGGHVVRTIELELERRTFLDWAYFTDFETYIPNSGTQDCRRYNQAPPDCGGIDFIGQDVVRGPLKSNDWIRFCGSPTFESIVESGRGRVYRRSDCRVSGNPIYRGGPPRECGRPPATPCPSEMPISNAQLLQDAERGGYVYQGSIEITPLANGRFRVWSRLGLGGVAPGPAQQRTQASAPPTSTTAEWNPPPNGVIYVRDKPAPGPAQARAYVRGTVRGPLTIGSAYRIFLWGSVGYNDTSPASRDVIGIIANESIIIGDDRVACNDPRKRPRNPRISGALLALNGNVRAWGIINPPDSCTDPGTGGSWVNGTLTINGAFAQKWRGVVGTYSGQTIDRGYAKDYSYDPRLGYVQPPRFMEPTNSSWRKVTWREVPPRP